jgi:sugar lactone lactonase YvrE
MAGSGGEIMAEYVCGKGAILGECPIWDDRAQALYWIDCRAPALHRLDHASGEVRSVPVAETIGSFALRSQEDENGGAVAAVASGLHFLDLKTGATTPIADPEPGQPDNRFNDGRVDPAGRFWTGTMNRRHAGPTGTVYRLDLDRTLTPQFGDITVTNGIAFAPDGRRLYFADSPTGTIVVFDLDPETGGLSNRRVFAGPEAAPGYPDGAAVDAEGYLWSARWLAGCVARFDPKGRLDRTIQVPVARVTCCAFGGPDLTTLYITTASQGSLKDGPPPEPLAGGLFAAHPGISGLPEHRYAG